MMKEFRHILFMRTGGHDWQPVDSDFKFTDHKGQEYIVEKCTQCGMTAQLYGDKHSEYDSTMDAIYISPAYPREHVMKCPEVLGLFKDADPEKEKTIAVLGGGECKPVKIKRKKKKGKKDKKKITRIRKPKKVKITRRKKS